MMKTKLSLIIVVTLAAIVLLALVCRLISPAAGNQTAAAPVQPGTNTGPSTTCVLSTSTLPSTEATETNDMDWGAPFGFLDAPPLPDNYAELGNKWIVPGFGWARWENIETTAGVYDWSAIDLTDLQQMDSLGIRVIPELRSVNSLYDTSWDVDEYPDGNVAAWEDFVTALVEKFDGDGVDDLEGAPTIRAYSFLHELAPSGINYWTDHPDEYAEMFDATYRAMKAACPDCVLFLPGGNLQHFQFQDEGALVDGWIVEVLGYLEGFTTQFDDIGFDYHVWASTASYDDPYSDGTDYRFHERLIEVIRHCYERFGYTDMPIICRESGMTGIGDDGSYTPNEPLQAAYVVKMYTLIASLGQKACAWTTTLEYAHGPTPGHLFRHMGLIHNPSNPDGLSHRKLAWYTYKKMTETLNGADWENVETVVDGVDNVYVYRFDVNGAPVTIAWWDYFDETSYTPGDTKPITLTGLSGTAITVTTVVPAADSGQEVSDYTTAFTVTTHLVSDGAVTILLGKDPVLVKETEGKRVYLPLVLR